MSAAVWFGATLTTAGDVRRGVDSGRVPELIERVKRVLMMSLIAGLLAIVSGLVIVLQRGGFRAFGPRMHLAFGIGIVALIVEVQVLTPILRSLATSTEPERWAGRFAVVTGVLHLLRVVVFGLMVFR
jgi:hypothetical protein